MRDVGICLDRYRAQEVEVEEGRDSCSLHAEVWRVTLSVSECECKVPLWTSA